MFHHHITNHITFPTTSHYHWNEKLHDVLEIPEPLQMSRLEIGPIKSTIQVIAKQWVRESQDGEHLQCKPDSNAFVNRYVELWEKMMIQRPKIISQVVIP
jgi:hypothetical protein